MAASKNGGYSGSRGPTNSGHGAPKSHRAKHSPPNPFRPGLATPKKSPGAGVGNDAYRTRHQNPAVLSQQSPGKQLVPLTSGTSEFRLPNKNQRGFSGVVRKDREDKKAPKANGPLTF